MKKFLLMAIVPSIMVCFLFSSTATASRVALTLGWHNLDSSDFYLVDNLAGNPNATFASLNEDSTIDSGKLKGTMFRDNTRVLAGSADNTGDPIQLGNLTPSGDGKGVWGLDILETGKFDKWIDKRTTKALKMAARRTQKANNPFGTKKGWRDLYNGWMTDPDAIEDFDAWVWDMYEKEGAIYAAFEKKFHGKKIKGDIGGIKYAFYMDIFANPDTPQVENQFATPVPEPATMILFGLGLLGFARISRKK